MPVSLRLPLDIEAQIAGVALRQGLSKSAVIVRSISEFLARHAQPSSLQIYEEVMRDAQVQSAGSRRQTETKADKGREATEQRPLKIQVRKAIRRKHAARSKRANRALARAPNAVKAEKLA